MTSAKPSPEEPSGPGVRSRPGQARPERDGLAVADELVFAIDGNNAVPAVPITLAVAGLKERDNLQEWILRNPLILGPGVLIITAEFDRWKSKAGQEKDRLDV